MSELEDERDKTWYGIGAATLSVIAGLGHLYLGISRGYWFIVISIILIIIGEYYWHVATWIYIQFAIFAAFDAFSFGKRGRGLF
ncbi:MAG: hypothetical protein NPIRA04_30290 [Nitrospirales bacterium]|nr:MAG: hypothetical protein NPIRA04_30290 [Nitrospirales bacterium]